MLSKHQYELLEEFADLNDQLFDLGITTTDSFTGEIAEYVACHHFKLIKSARVAKAVVNSLKCTYSKDSIFTCQVINSLCIIMVKIDMACI